MQVFAGYAGRPAPIFMRQRRVMEQFITYVSLDVHKETIAVALADAGKRSEVRDYGTITRSQSASLWTLPRTKFPPF
jgi:hypothetical protein